MLACTAMLVGCTSDDVIDNVTPESNGTNQYAVKINLSYPSSKASSRTFEPSFSHGDEAEYYVQEGKTLVKFYDATKNFLGSSSNIEWNDKTNDEGDHVTLEGTVMFRSAFKPIYAIVFINDKSSKELDNYSIAELKKLVLYDKQHLVGGNPNGDKVSYTLDETANYEGRNFLMTNSSWYNDGELVQEVNVENSVVEIPDTETNTKEFLENLIAKGDLTPTDIYVERVVAKVELGIELTNTKVSEDEEIYQLSYTTTSGSGAASGDNVSAGVAAPYAIKIIGWGLNGTNRTFYALKNITAPTGETWNEAWNETEGRSYWGYDANYNLTASNYLTKSIIENDKWDEYDPTLYALNYHTLDQIQGKIGEAQYCYENTTPAWKEGDTYSAFTHVVLKAQYMEEDANGNWVSIEDDEDEDDEYAYRINQVIWNEENFRKHIAAYLIDDYIYKVGEGDVAVQLDQDGLAEKLIFNVDSKTAEVTIGLSGVNVFTKAGIEVLESIDFNSVANAGEIIAYKNGYCYYTIPIKHFGTTGTSDFEGKAKTELGHYGVVRNHWYQLEVTSIAGFGEPGTGNPIVPEDNDELIDWAVICNLNINAWSLVSQGSITVGGSDTTWD